MPFQHVCVETLRKYINNDKPIHMADFKNAYKLLGGGSTCFVATSLMDLCNPDTMPILRDFRDQTLSRYRAGRAFIGWYYRNGPQLALWVDRCPRWARAMMALVLDVVVRFMVWSPRPGPIGPRCGETPCRGSRMR